MAKSQQTASSAKPSRSARKARPTHKKGGQREPARQGRRPATAPRRSGAKRAGPRHTLLGRDTGASLMELIAATGWLPHTTLARP